MSQHEASEPKADRLSEIAADLDQRLRDVAAPLLLRGLDAGVDNHQEIRTARQVEIRAALESVVRDSARYVAKEWMADTRRLKVKPPLNLNDGKDQFRWIAATLRSWWGLEDHDGRA